MFICIAEGDPEPQIQWRLAGKNLKPDADDPKAQSSAGRYVITPLSFPAPDSSRSPAAGLILRIEPARDVRDETPYECVAENGVGDPVYAYAQLHVLRGNHFHPKTFFF
jgi:netrin-G3 ligand